MAERSTRKLIGPYGRSDSWNDATRPKVKKQVRRRIRRKLKAPADPRRESR